VEKNEKQIIVILVAIFLAVSLLSVPTVESHLSASRDVYSRAQVQVQTILPIEIGYGPNSLLPMSMGIPIFSGTDQIWVLSNYNSTVTIGLECQSGTSYSYVSSLPFIPNTISMLYSFANVSQVFPGYCQSIQNLLLTVQEQNSSLSIPITYIQYPSINGPSISNLSTTFSGSQLVVNLSYVKISDYNDQLCVFGQNIPHTVSINVPAGFGIGTVQIAPNLNTTGVEVNTSSIILPSTVFWFELYTTYSYTEQNSTGLVSYQVEAAKSTPTALSGTPQTFVQLSNYVSIRPGRYVLRAFFDNATSLSVFQTNILVVGPNLPWVWLAGCYPATQNTLTSYTIPTNIVEPPSSRPQVALLMYDYKGVEALEVYPLNLSIAEIGFTTSPFNVPLEGIGVSITNNSQIVSSEFYNNTWFIQSDQYPVRIGFNFTFGNKVFGSASTLVSANSLSSINVPLSAIVAKVENNGALVSGANVSLVRGGSLMFSATTDKGGRAVFYVPSGNYDLVGSYFGATSTQSIATNVNQTSNALFQFAVSTQPQTPSDYLNALIVVGVVGVVGNLIVWISYLKRRRSYH
jgi:hypothetical protein